MKQYTSRPARMASGAGAAEKQHAEEPEAKKMRLVKPRIVKKVTRFEDLEPANPFPSLRHTASSGERSNNASPRQNPSAIPSRQTKPAYSCRDRFFTPVVKTEPDLEPTPAAALALIARQKNPKPGPTTVKISISPFFKSLMTAFHVDSPARVSFTNNSLVPFTGHHQQSLPRQLSPVTERDELIRQLKDHFLSTADNLHQRAMSDLAKVHDNLARKLRHAMDADNAVLRRLRKQVRTISKPLSEFTVASQLRGPDGVLKPKASTVGALHAEAQGQLEELEAQINQLWKDWAASEIELEKIRNECFPPDASPATEGKKRKRDEDDAEPSAPAVAGGQLEKRVAEILEAIEENIQKAEEEVIDLGNTTARLMKEIERDYRKAVIPDLHLYYQSIDVD
ncbi:hypothetical protein B0H63DRAFT_478347 [Podospora didyma]|uniref:Uncharacterized protein n=1 Tax=Podospora didyma TaxID=330526 RepID=A0AAE0NC11_9PEZI|nr:hypothetical protein B0H63DRAFT_478347 [Podospora didyma]